MATDCQPIGARRRPRRRSPARGLALVSLATLAAAVGGTPAAGATARHVTAATHGAAAVHPPAQGLYDECAPALDPDGCAGRLQTMAGAGFTVVLNYTVWTASPAQVLAYAAAAHALRLKVIWPLNDVAWRDGADLRAHYPLLAAGCGCTDNAGFLRYVVGLVSPLPATWGYYVADEPSGADLGAVAALAELVKALDPAHPTLVIGYGSPGSDGGLDPFANGVDVAGDDLYPIGSQAPPSSVGTVSRGISALAARRHRTAAMVLQAFSYAQYATSMPTTYARWPTATEMLAMRNAAVTAGDPALLLWYSYYDVMRSADPAGHWRDLVHAAFARWPAATRASAATTRLSARRRTRRRATAGGHRRPSARARRPSNTRRSPRRGTPARP
jgi:hypothetical protein